MVGPDGTRWIREPGWQGTLAGEAPDDIGESKALDSPKRGGSPRPTSLPPLRGGAIIIHVDGAHNWYTGAGAAGAVAFDEDGKPMMRCYRYFPKRTHNQAEYLAVILGIRLAYQLKTEERVAIITDCQLVAKTFAGEWTQKSPLLLPYLETIRERIKLIPGGVDIAWARKDLTKDAHDAAKKAMSLRNREIRWQMM